MGWSGLFPMHGGWAGSIKDCLNKAIFTYFNRIAKHYNDKAEIILK